MLSHCGRADHKGSDAHQAEQEARRLPPLRSVPRSRAKRLHGGPGGNDRPGGGRSRDTPLRPQSAQENEPASGYGKMEDGGWRLEYRLVPDKARGVCARSLSGATDNTQQSARASCSSEDVRLLATLFSRAVSSNPGAVHSSVQWAFF